jgi:outer membrane murein-binding lipoprotein Lpp
MEKLKMKKITIFIALVMTLLIAGCSKDGEINAFISEFDGITNDMAAKIDDGDIDGAKAAFDAKKDSFKTKLEGIKTARGFQVSEETTKKLTESVTKNMSTLQGSMMKNVGKLATDKPKMDKLMALVKEYGDVFK